MIAAWLAALNTQQTEGISLSRLQKEKSIQFILCNSLTDHNYSLEIVNKTLPSSSTGELLGTNRTNPQSRGLCRDAKRNNQKKQAISTGQSMVKTIQ